MGKKSRRRQLDIDRLPCGSPKPGDTLEERQGDPDGPSGYLQTKIDELEGELDSVRSQLRDKEAEWDRGRAEWQAELAAKEVASAAKRAEAKLAAKEAVLEHARSIQREREESLGRLDLFAKAQAAELAAKEAELASAAKRAEAELAAKEAELERERSVRREREESLGRLAPFAKAQLVQWYWGDGNCHNAFNPAENYQVEKAYSENQGSTSVQCGRYTYTIDFGKMEQINTLTGRPRPIKREVVVGGSAADAADIVQSVQVAMQARIQDAVGARAERDEARAQLEEARAELDTAREELEEAEKEMHTLDTRHIEAARRNCRLEDKVTALQKDLDSQSEVAKRDAGEKARLEAKVRDLEGESALLRTAAQQSSQKERGLLAKLGDAQGEIDQLQKEVGDSALLQAEAAKAAQRHREVLSVLNFWRRPAEPLQVKLLPEPSIMDPARKWLHSLSHTAAQHSGMPSICAGMQKAVLHSVEYVHNPFLWKKYRDSKDELMQVHKSLKIIVRPLSPPAPHLEGIAGGSGLPPLGPELDSSMNEVLLFHGCPEKAAESIAQGGFDARYAEEKGLYGEGIYFASQPCKAMQYAKTAAVKYMFVARVLLGDPAYLKGQTKGKLPPQKKPGLHYDSSVVNPEDSQRGQSHREFVVFDSNRVYPELLIKYEIPP